VNKYNSSEKLSLAITPEGTRSRVIKWRTGFLNIAREANVPILLGVLDYSTKSIYIRDVFKPSGDNEEDMRRIKDYYRPYQGKYPDKFSTEY
jgi:1-acyl-sn-glycerol-3-phosphate acyltransferase